MPEGAVFRDARTSPPIRVSYTKNLFKAQFFPGKPIEQQTGRFSLTAMIDKTSKEQMDFLRLMYSDCQSVLNEKWPDPATRPRIPLSGHDLSVFKDGDTANDTNGIPLREKNPEYAGHWIIRLGTTIKPPVVDRSRNPITDSNEVYGGCWCHVSMNAYSFVQPQKKGVTIGLNGVQKTNPPPGKSDEAFGSGRPSVDQMFDPGAEDDPANYGGEVFGANPFNSTNQPNPFNGAGQKSPF